MFPLPENGDSVHQRFAERLSRAKASSASVQFGLSPNIHKERNAGPSLFSTEISVCFVETVQAETFPERVR